VLQDVGHLPFELIRGSNPRSGRSENASIYLTGSTISAARSLCSVPVRGGRVSKPVDSLRDSLKRGMAFILTAVLLG
jgi:hypothetical protein